MKNLIRKSILLGIGAASMTKEKIDELVGEFVKKKAITTKEGEWVARKVLSEIAKNKRRLEKLAKMQAEVLENKAKSLEKKLLKHGRKTARKILRMASKELK